MRTQYDSLNTTTVYKTATCNFWKLSLWSGGPIISEWDRCQCCLCPLARIIRSHNADCLYKINACLYTTRNNFVHLSTEKWYHIQLWFFKSVQQRATIWRHTLDSPLVMMSWHGSRQAPGGPMLAPWTLLSGVCSTSLLLCGEKLPVTGSFAFTKD